MSGLGFEHPHVQYVLRLADTALVLAQRLGDWVGSAPTLEEELAMANIALDLLGQSTALLEHAADLEGAGRSADELAFRRDAHEFRNALLVERPNGDFAHTIVRQTIYEAYAAQLWPSLAASSDEQLAGIAGKAAKETAYHLEHVGDWLVRLGDGTDESRSRTEAAILELWPYAGELVIADDVDGAVADADIAPSCAELAPAWRATLDTLVERATLEPLPAGDDSWWQTGGKQGRHTEQLGHLLAEMQFLQRAYPDARW